MKLVKLIKFLVVFLAAFPAFAIDYEGDVKALSPTSWFKSYYGNTPGTGTGVWGCASTRDFSGNSLSFVQAASANRPRFTYAPNIENLVPANSSLDVWSNNGITLTANAIANPVNGQLDADHMLATINGAYRFLDIDNYIFRSGTYISSVYVKADTATYAQFRAYDGTSKYTTLKFSDGTCTTTAGTTCTVNALSGGWYRVVQTWPNPSGINGQFLICPASGTGDLCVGNNTTSMYVWGAQLRNSDTINTYVSNDWYVARIAGLQGLSALFFDGNNDYMTCPSALSNFVTANGKTLYAALRVRRLPSSGNAYVFTDTGEYFRFGFSAAGQFYASNYDGNHDSATLPAALTLQTPYIIKITHDGVNLVLTDHVQSNSAASGNTASIANAIRFGQLAAGNYAAMDITELITFNTVLSTANQQKVYDYLNWTINNPWKRVEVTP